MASRYSDLKHALRTVGYGLVMNVFSFIAIKPQDQAIYDMCLRISQIIILLGLIDTLASACKCLFQKEEC